MTLLILAGKWGRFGAIGPGRSWAGARSLSSPPNAICPTPTAQRSKKWRRVSASIALRIGPELFIVNRLLPRKELIQVQQNAPDGYPRRCDRRILPSIIP